MSSGVVSVKRREVLSYESWSELDQRACDGQVNLSGQKQLVIPHVIAGQRIESLALV